MPRALDRLGRRRSLTSIVRCIMRARPKRANALALATSESPPKTPSMSVAQADLASLARGNRPLTSRVCGNDRCYFCEFARGAGLPRRIPQAVDLVDVRSRSNQAPPVYRDRERSGRRTIDTMTVGAPDATRSYWQSCSLQLVGAAVRVAESSTRRYELRRRRRPCSRPKSSMI